MLSLWWYSKPLLYSGCFRVFTVTAFRCLHPVTSPNMMTSFLLVPSTWKWSPSGQQVGHSRGVGDFYEVNTLRLWTHFVNGTVTHLLFDSQQGLSFPGPPLSLMLQTRTLSHQVGEWLCSVSDDIVLLTPCTRVLAVLSCNTVSLLHPQSPLFSIALRCFSPISG